MSDNNKLCKFIAKAAVVGASIAALFAIVTKLRKRKNAEQVWNEFEEENEDEDFDIFDFAEIGKDSQREYVSININERIKKEEKSSGMNEKNVETTENILN